MTYAVNGPLIKQRRIEASLGLAHAARLLGVGTPALTRLERDEVVDRAISIDGLLGLAAALGCNPADLFVDTQSAPTLPEPTSANTTVTPELLIGLLRECDGQVTLKDLAAAFDCTNAAIQVAANQAQYLLQGTGLRLANRDYMYFLTSTQQAQVTTLHNRIETTGAARHGMDNGQARVLSQVLNGQLQSGRRSIYTNSMLAYFTRLGVLKANDAGTGHQPSEALTFALDV